MRDQGFAGFKSRNPKIRFWVPLWLGFALLFVLGCAGTRPSADSAYQSELNGNGSEYLVGEQQEYLEDSLSVSKNLARAAHHFHLAQQAIGDEDPDRVLDELEQTITLLSLADENIDSANYYRLTKISLDILESYQDFLKELNVLPDDFVPEGVLLGDEEFYDSLQEWSDWYEDGRIIMDTSLAVSETIDIFPPVPLLKNRKVDQVIDYFRGRGRKVFLRWMDRAQTALPRIQEILHEEGLPEELAYLAMIESGLNPKAYSWAHASGVWQFIRSTGRLFGLHSDWWYDERRDLEKSTHAAAGYLRKLYLEFDDWYLALAAYNCGELRVHRVIQQQGSRNFWKLWRLPRQTENYVPTYLAAAIIMENPTEYGFPEFQPLEVVEDDMVWIKGCVDMSVLANCAGTDATTLKEMNPHILRWCTPPTVDSVAVAIPAGTSEQFWSKYLQLPQDQKTKWVRHRVRSGETLSSIANMYGTTIGAIMDVPENNLRNVRRVPVGKFLLIPAPPGGVTTASTNQPESYTDASDVDDDVSSLTYRVRSGDTLGKIASRYGVSVQNLRDWNHLGSKRYIYPGQILEIHARDSGSASVASSTEANGSATHTVRRGESLWSLAQKYGVSISDIQTANSMGRRTRIKPGEVLVIPNRRRG